MSELSERVTEVPYSHLYPGLVIDVPEGADDFLILFADDSESRVQLLTDDTGRPVLRVGGYLTARGTVVDERVWTIRESVRHGGRVRVKLGRSLP